MPAFTFRLPIPAFVRRKIDSGRAKLASFTPLALLHRRLAEADSGSAPPPSSSERLSLPTLLEKHGRWSTALMCGAIEEVALNVLIYKNGPTSVCEGSLPQARVVAQKAVLFACEMLLTKSAEVVDRGVDVVQCLTGRDNGLADKEKVNQMMREFFESRVHAPALRIHKVIFDAADDLVASHKLLQVQEPQTETRAQLQSHDQHHNQPQYQYQNQHQNRLQNGLLSLPSRAKRTVQRAMSAASLMVLSTALAHASAATMASGVVSSSDDCMDDDDDDELPEEEEKEEDEHEEGDEPKQEHYRQEQQEENITQDYDQDHEKHQDEKMDDVEKKQEENDEEKSGNEANQHMDQATDDAPIPAPNPETQSTPAPVAHLSMAMRSHTNDGSDDKDDSSIMALDLTRLAMPGSFITGNGDKYRVKTPTRKQASSKSDTLSKHRHTATKTKTSTSQSKTENNVPTKKIRRGGHGSKAKESVLGIRARIPMERLEEGARVVAEEQEAELGVEVKGDDKEQISEITRSKQAEVPATQSVNGVASDEVHPKSDASTEREASTPSRNRPTTPQRFPSDYYPPPGLSWFALETGLQSVRDIIKDAKGRSSDLWHSTKETNGPVYYVLKVHHDQAKIAPLGWHASQSEGDGRPVDSFKQGIITPSSSTPMEETEAETPTHVGRWRREVTVGAEWRPVSVRKWS